MTLKNGTNSWRIPSKPWIAAAIVIPVVAAGGAFALWLLGLLFVTKADLASHGLLPHGDAISRSDARSEFVSFVAYDAQRQAESSLSEAYQKTLVEAIARVETGVSLNGVAMNDLRAEVQSMRVELSVLEARTLSERNRQGGQ